MPLPTPFGHDAIGTHPVPLLDNVLPIRFALYTALVAGVIAAIWISTTRFRTLRLGAARARRDRPRPEPVGRRRGRPRTRCRRSSPSAAYRTCLSPDENVLPQPVGAGGQATLWQAVDAFRYRLAGGRLTTAAPSAFQHPATIAQIAVGNPPVSNQAALLRAYFAAKHVTSVIVDPRQASTWTPALDRIAKPVAAGGVILYRVGGATAGSCP